MPRILGVDIPNNKKILHSLTYIKGIGLNRSATIVKELKVDENMKASELTEDQISQISSIIDANQFVVEGDLDRKTRDDIKRLIDIGSYRGDRHKNKLPVRGQKTKANARTRKGPKTTIGGVSVRKAVSKT